MPPSNILLIAYYFPPVRVVSALRLGYWAREAQRQGSRCWVITTRNREGMPHDSALASLADLPMKTVATLDLRGLRGQRTPTLTAAWKRRPWVREVLRVLDSFPWNILFGDGGLVYILNAYRLGSQLVQKEGITEVFTSFRPYSDHAVGWLLKRRFPHLVWIADFRDLHLDPSAPPRWWPGLQRWFNRQMLGKADCLTTVSEGLAKELLAYHPRVEVLRNGIAPEALVTPVAPPATFRVTYTGGLYPDRQDARPLFAAIRKLLDSGDMQGTDLRIHYAGKDAALWQSWISNFGLDAWSTAQDMVDLPAARTLQQQSAVNIVLSWSENTYYGVLTAKLYDYLAAGRPILALVKGDNDPELTQILHAYGPGACFTTSQSAELQAWLLAEYQAWVKGQVPTITEAWRQELTWPVIYSRWRENQWSEDSANQ